VGRLESIYREHGDRVNFLLVYIQEAHPTDGWQVPINETESVLHAQPTTDEEREVVAKACTRDLTISIPTLIDRMTNEVDRAYAALPTRLYLIDSQGLIAYRGGPGPWGLKPEELEAAVLDVVGG
jgi:hypothetical protein